MEQAVEEALLQPVDQQAEETTNPAAGDLQTRDEGVEQAVETVVPEPGEEQAAVQDKPPGDDDDDMTITPVDTNRPPNPEDVVILDSDDENDHNRDSDDDDKEPDQDKKEVIDKKTGGRVKVDKDWFTQHMEMLARREARAKAEGRN